MVTGFKSIRLYSDDSNWLEAKAIFDIRFSVSSASLKKE